MAKEKRTRSNAGAAPQPDRSEKLGKMPIGKLLVKMSLPAVISMLVQALYNIVDSMFVSSIPGEEGAIALEAVSIAFPFQTLFMAFAIGIGVGSASLISRHLGEGDKYSASKVASTGLVVSLIHCAIFMILGATVIRPLASLFTTDARTVDMVVKYLSVCLIFSAGVFVDIFINKVNQAMGIMTIPMISQLIGAITNIILDPIFIFTFGLGVQGAAIATVVGQFAAMIFAIIAFVVKKADVSISLKYVRMRGATLVNIYKIGLPTIMLNAVSSFTVMILNSMLKGFGYQSGVSILGVYFKVQSFVFMPCFGLNQGLLPVLAYNYGANNKKRFTHAYRLSMTVALGIMVFGTIVFQTMSGVILQAFKSISVDALMLADAIRAFRIISASFLFAATNVINVTLFQSVGYGVNSMLLSIFRQVVLLIPIGLLLMALTSANNMWWAYPISEAIVASIFFPLAIRVINKVFARKEVPLFEGENNAA